MIFSVLGIDLACGDVKVLECCIRRVAFLQVKIQYLYIFKLTVNGKEEQPGIVFSNILP